MSATSVAAGRPSAPAMSATSLAVGRPSTTSSSAASSSTGSAIIAVANVTPFGDSNVRGTVNFRQSDAKSPTIITYDLTGITPSTLRAIHIHELPNTNCNATMGHYNPNMMPHGLLGDRVRHAGDLGNIVIDSSGNAKGSLIASLVTLVGDKRVVNRTFVMHNGVDDGGRTGVGTSNSTGNSGIRVACGIINLVP
ncbi:hypothetical protein OPT61_g3902 [Boeremia exigua]|uniref:Uncharacterized protein n=1 Tax=Boeremia exigua TaxID=749465 RepID=A0ACC2IG67_9PLEO|nr:hypothetical protein OPT61_g3902 [Boeremia exigua]